MSSLSKSAHVCCHLEKTSAANAKKLLQMFVFYSPGNQDSFIAALLLVCFWFLTGIWLPKPWRVLKSKPYSVRILLITLVPVGQPHFLFLPTSCLRIIFFSLGSFHIPSRLLFPLSGLLSDSTHITPPLFFPPSQKAYTLAFYERCVWSLQNSGHVTLRWERLLKRALC